MKRRHLLSALACLAVGAVATVKVAGQTNTAPNYVAGVTYQNFNPNYPKPNPFYFEGKIDWNKLGITNPANAWEYMERAIHKQDDLGDLSGAMADYEQALSMNSLQKGTCQVVTAASLNSDGSLPSTLNPAPCMFTVRLRMAYLLRESDPARAISLYNEVLQIDPLRLGVNEMIGETYIEEAKAATDHTQAAADYQNAIKAFEAEIALSPVDAQYTALTGDKANNAHAHWALAEAYDALGQEDNESKELQLYLEATQWHSDVYPWRITLAQKKLQAMRTGAVRENRLARPKQ